MLFQQPVSCELLLDAEGFIVHTKEQLSAHEPDGRARWKTTEPTPRISAGSQYVVAWPKEGQIFRVIDRRTGKEFRPELPAGIEELTVVKDVLLASSSPKQTIVARAASGESLWKLSLADQVSFEIARPIVYQGRVYFTAFAKSGGLHLYALG